MRQAENADHGHPLGFGGTFEEVGGLPVHAGDDGQQQEGVHRNQKGKQAVPFAPYQIVLPGQQDVEAGRHAVIIAAAAVNQGHEFAQGGKGNQEKEDDRADFAEPESGQQDKRHQPPGINAGIQVGDGGVGRAVFASQPLADQRGNEQDGENGGKDVTRLGGKAGGGQGEGDTGRHGRLSEWNRGIITLAVRVCLSRKAVVI